MFFEVVIVEELGLVKINIDLEDLYFWKLRIFVIFKKYRNMECIYWFLFLGILIFLCF